VVGEHEHSWYTLEAIRGTTALLIDIEAAHNEKSLILPVGPIEKVWQYAFEVKYGAERWHWDYMAVV
jgi:hypothetical protein